MKKIWLFICLIYIIINVSGQIEEVIIPSDLKQQTIITEPATLIKAFSGLGPLIVTTTNDRIFDESGKKSYLFGYNALVNKLVP